MFNKTEYINLVTEYRRYLHTIPEIAFDLFETCSYVKNKLDEFGFQTEMVAKTGIVAYKQGESLEAIAFRADMDALRVLEKTNVSFASKNIGQMHACGHDGHMAILLGFANYISTLKNLKKSIVLIFQPAEEGPGGAKVIINEGVFSKYNISSVFGIHLYPGLEEGKIGLVEGAMTAQNGEFDILIEGKSSHGAEPHLGCDAILAASQLISNYHTIVSRNIDPLTSAVVTIGTVSGGEARNIIANKVELTGTIRSFDSNQFEFIKSRMRAITQAIETMHNVRVKINIVDYYPPVFNDSQLVNTLKECLDDDEYVIAKPMMFAEDFSFYQKVVPGVFCVLGVKSEEKGYIHPLHSCYFNFDEKVLVKGIELYIKICEKLDVLN